MVSPNACPYVYLAAYACHTHCAAVYACHKNIVQLFMRATLCAAVYACRKHCAFIGRPQKCSGGAPCFPTFLLLTSSHLSMTDRNRGTNQSRAEDHHAHHTLTWLQSWIVAADSCSTASQSIKNTKQHHLYSSSFTDDPHTQTRPQCR